MKAVAKLWYITKMLSSPASFMNAARWPGRDCFQQNPSSHPHPRFYHHPNSPDPSGPIQTLLHSTTCHHVPRSRWRIGRWYQKWYVSMVHVLWEPSSVPNIPIQDTVIAGDCFYLHLHKGAPWACDFVQSHCRILCQNMTSINDGQNY